VEKEMAYMNLSTIPILNKRATQQKMTEENSAKNKNKNCWYLYVI